MQLITDEAIAAALRAKAQDAFGVAPTTPFMVGAIQPHGADITYTVTCTLSCKIASRRVKTLTAEHWNVDHVNQALQARGDLLMDNPAHFRPMLLKQLSSHADHYRKPGQGLLTADTERFCTRQKCNGCNGHGAVYCSSCDGHAQVKCRRCHGTRHQHCHYCSGSGKNPQRRRCSACGGTGRFGNARCMCGGGLLPADPCHGCGGQGAIQCPDCNAQGMVRCKDCSNGQVRCKPCEGSGELIHEYHLDVYADRQVHYTWRNLSADWLEPVIREALNGPQNAAVFAIDHIHAEHPNPTVFTATGHVPAAEAEVSHEGNTGTCRFVGQPPIALHLGGVLHGNFRKLLASLDDPTDIRAVQRASHSKVARQLIAENEQQLPIEQTTAVQQGLIDPGDALELLHKRADTWRHIVSTRHRFRWVAVLGLSLPLTVLLFSLYLMMSFYLPGLPEPGTGALGVIALLSDPLQVGKMFYLQLLLHSSRPLGLGTIVWFGAALLFNRFSLALLFPRLWTWAAGRWLRILLLAVPGMLWLNAFMALYPAAEMWMDWVHLKNAFNRQGVMHALTNALYLLPQIYLLALGLALVRWRAAGTHWARRMMKKLLQKNDISAMEAHLN